MLKDREPKRLVLATNNQHKLREIRGALGSEWMVLGVQDVAPGVTWQETGQTFLENARIKVKALRPHVTGLILADDSGLCVDALRGRPVVDSSHFGGVEGDHVRNLAHLQAEMAHIPEGKRGAHFFCLLLLVDEGGTELRLEARCDGHIATRASGAGGFGYDPVFIPLGFKKSLAEMSEAEKNGISHRGKAVALLKKALAVNLASGSFCSPGAKN